MMVVVLEDAAEDIELGRRSFYFGFHRMLSKRFPFGIYYEVEDAVAYVYAILDLRRDPLWIHSKLQARR